jgi:hypothetical protein
MDDLALLSEENQEVPVAAGFAEMVKQVPIQVFAFLCILCA